MPDHEWRTYAELAAAWSISTKAAKARVRRSGWTRVEGNDGVVRVQSPAVLPAANPPRVATTEGVRMPLPALSEPPGVPAMPAADPARSSATDALVAELRARVEVAEALVAELRGRAEHAEALHRAAVDEAMALRGMLDRTLIREARPWWRRLIG